MENEIIIYQPNNLSIRFNVILEDESVWLTQRQIVELFNSSKANISEHISNVFSTKELNENSTVRKFRTVQVEGNRKVNRDLLHYNLDVIISVGYRVNSKQGTQFRIWATKVLKNHLLKGYTVNKRINRIEDKVENLSEQISEMKLEIKTSLPPIQGVFFEGEIFDAYTLVCDIIRSAKINIILIDNYVDDSVLKIIAKKQPKVCCRILSKNINAILKQDVQKYKEQYGNIEIQKFNKSHDRFLIIDNHTVYHIGASLKDLGKKWFAFTKIDKNAVRSLLEMI